MGYMVRAVVVGINNYGDPRNDMKLQYAQHDAEEIASVVKASTTLRMAADNPILLTNAQATERAVRSALENCFAPHGLTRNTIALFYFAGHGIVKNDNRIFLGCHDVDFSDAEHGGIRLNDIYDWLVTCDAECVIAIIDACFSGGLTTRIPDTVLAAQQARKAIEQLRGPSGKNIAMLAACNSNEHAREIQSLKHGIFTYAILRGWGRGDARDEEGTVYLTGLVDYLQRSFQKDKQKPQISLLSGSSILLDKKTPPSTPPIDDKDNSASRPKPEPPAKRPIPPPPIPPRQPERNPNSFGPIKIRGQSGVTPDSLYTPLVIPRDPSSPSLAKQHKTLIIFAILFAITIILALIILRLVIMHIIGS